MFDKLKAKIIQSVICVNREDRRNLIYNKNKFKQVK